jgi:hypothetical protein
MARGKKGTFLAVCAGTSDLEEDPPRSLQDLPSLADLGINHNESSRCQSLAAIPEPIFEGLLQRAELLEVLGQVNAMVGTEVPRWEAVAARRA